MTAGIESLYPFLYERTSDSRDARTQLIRSTEEKAREIVGLRDRLLHDEAARLTACAADMAVRFLRGGRLYAFGNGGSSSDAQAVVQLFLNPPHGRALPAVALTNDVAAVTALSNDVGFDVVFSRQLAAFARPDDIAFALSTSGGSTNVLLGLDQAARVGMLTVGLAGHDGGAMAEGDDIAHLFVMPSTSVHRIQEAQTTVYDVLWELVQLALP